MNDIGRYRLVAAIGHGGMADVFLALAPGPNGFTKAIVVKELRGDEPDERAVAMFLDEARIAARLNHPNVAQIHEVGYRENGRPFLAMEFVEGQSLQSLVRRARGGAPRPVLLRVMSDVLSALDYAHTLCDFDGTPLAIVHRDVSPHNVIVSYDGFGKLVDFGIAKASVRSAHTQAGTLKGKVTYMAPEQAAGRPVDARADLFSVGVMLYQALTGLRFWGDEDDMPVLVRLAGGRLPDVRAGLAGVPEGLAAIVCRAVAADPAARYATAAEFQADLEQFGAAHRAMATRREVGAYVGGLFAAERVALRDVLDRRSRAHGASARGEPDGDVPQLHLSGAAPALYGEGSGSLPKPSVTGTLRSMPLSAPPPAGAPSGTTLRAAAVAALVAVAISGAYVLRGGPARGGRSAAAPESPPAVVGAGPADAAPAPPAGGAAPAPASAAATPSAAPAAPPPAVALTVEARPAHARVFVDDEPLATNPATAPVAAAVEHQVRAEAEGFAPASQAVTPGGDESIVLTLRPLPKGRPGAAAAPPPRPAPALAPKAPPAQREPASSSAAKGADLAGF